MLSRTLLLVAALLLLTATLTSVMTPNRLREGHGARVLSQVRPVTPEADTGTTVRGRLPGSKPVEAQVGDVVELRVVSDEPDVADLIDLGIDVPIGPDLDGTVRFVADFAGSFDVRSVVTGRRIGVLRVRPRAGS